jgi:hypothetical protein
LRLSTECFYQTLVNRKLIVLFTFFYYVLTMINDKNYVKMTSLGKHTDNKLIERVLITLL